MKRVLAMTVAGVFTLGTGIAFAGSDNDYEGRVKGTDDTYVGFNLSNDGKKVKKITGYFHFKCNNGKEGSVPARTKGELKVKDGKFEGKTKGPSKGTMIFETTGKLGKDGKAHGTIEATLKVSDELTCTARNDGEWSAKKGREVEVELPPRV
jgi:hypothetical protein